ncbi:hypothetical protein CEN41_24025, partial [Fischerella thermalis CCMEE 5330]
MFLTFVLLVASQLRELNAVETLTFTRVDYAVAGNGPKSIVVGDLNQDGNLDMAVANRHSKNISVLFNQGNASFGVPVNYSVGTQPLDLAIADFDKDLDLDLVTANSGSRNISVLLNSGNGSFGTVNDFNVGGGPYGVTIGDFNLDSHIDIAVANNNSNSVAILLTVRAIKDEFGEI